MKESEKSTLSSVHNDHKNNTDFNSVIQDFLVIKKESEEFGYIAIKKGYATIQDIKNALLKQLELFKKNKIKKMIGEILVESELMTKEQKESILKDQKVIKIKREQKKRQISSSNQAGSYEKTEFSEQENSYEQIEIAKYQNIVIDAPIVGKETIRKGKIVAFIDSDQIEIKIKDVFAKTLVDIDSINLGLDADTLIFRCEKCITFSEDKSKILSKQSGYPALSIEGRFYIFPVVNVIGDADLRFGQIDQYASLNVSGILTGAYPVNAGQIQSNEIRGAVISSVGNVLVEVGIISSRITTQGDVRAKYIHNSRIEAFGDVIVEHEIIDSTIIISGKCDAAKGRIIASNIYAKMGVAAMRIGSSITEPCFINAGCQEHINLKSLEIDRQIKIVKKEIDDLISKKEGLENEIKEIFKNMVDIKVTHDSAKADLKELELDNSVYSNSNGMDNNPNRVNSNLNEMDSNNIRDDKNKILEELKIKVQESLELLKKYNKQKKTLEINLENIKNDITKIKPKVEMEIQQLQFDKNSFLKWAGLKPPCHEIKVFGNISDETIIEGTKSIL